MVGISIHALREEGDEPQVRRFSGSSISIHALREEGDFFDGLSALERLISIHALREEGDQLSSFSLHKISDFYPRPPRGGRHRDGQSD